MPRREMQMRNVVSTPTLPGQAHPVPCLDGLPFAHIDFAQVFVVARVLRPRTGMSHGDHAPGKGWRNSRTTWFPGPGVGTARDGSERATETTGVAGSVLTAWPWSVPAVSSSAMTAPTASDVASS